MAPQELDLQDVTGNIGNIFQIGEALEERISQLEDKLEDQISKVIELSRIGTVFTSILDLEVVLPMVIETAVSMVRGEVGELVIYGKQGGVRSVSWGLSAEITSLIKTESGKNIYEHVRESGESLAMGKIAFDPELSPSHRNVNIQSLLVSPLKSRDRVIGAIAVANKMSDAGFDPEDKFALEMIGNFAAVAIINAELHQETLKKQKLDQELQIARHVQHCLMPEKEIVLDEVSIFAYNAQAAQLGGDFFDILEISPRKYLVVVADVSNKGVPAALTMASTRAYIRLAAENMGSLAQLAAKVNNLLCRDTEKLDGVFVTMVMGLLDFTEREITLVNAGHPPCLMIRGSELIKIGSGGTILGQFPNIDFQEFRIRMIRGDKLVIFTDGLFECVNAKNEMLGIEKVTRFILENANLGWPEFLKKLKSLMGEFSFDPGRIDDTTLMLIEVNR